MNADGDTPNPQLLADAEVERVDRGSSLVRTVSPASVTSGTNLRERPAKPRTNDRGWRSSPNPQYTVQKIGGLYRLVNLDHAVLHLGLCVRLPRIAACKEERADDNQR